LPGKPAGIAAKVEQQQCINKSKEKNAFSQRSTSDLKAPGQGKSKTKVMQPVSLLFFSPSLTRTLHHETQALVCRQKKLHTIKYIFSPMNIN